MSRWFRHYAGMMRDEKLVRVAVKSKQSVERVVWVWGAILESAAEINDGGRFEFDAAEAAYFLHCDESELACVLDSLAGFGRISDGVVARWNDRQFESDTSRERQRRYRERQSAGNHRGKRHGDGGIQTSDVTRPSRDGEVTLQETETETDSEEANASSSPEPAKAAPVAWLPCVTGEPYPIFETDIAEWRASFPAVDVRQQLEAMRSWFIANPTRRKTRKGMRRFIVTWLDKRQNAGGSASGVRATAPPTHSEHVNAALDRIINGKSHEPSTIDAGFERGNGGSAEIPLRLVASSPRN